MGLTEPTGRMVADPEPAPTASPHPILGGVVPYLMVDGAMRAADFYVAAFGAEDVTRMPPDAQGRTMHCHLRVNGTSVMLSDPFPEHGHAAVAPAGFTLHLQVQGIEAWWDRAVAAGASVAVPLHDAFWGDRYGQLRDPFGVTWSLGAART